MTFGDPTFDLILKNDLSNLFSFLPTFARRLPRVSKAIPETELDGVVQIPLPQQDVEIQEPQRVAQIKSAMLVKQCVHYAAFTRRLNV